MAGELWTSKQVIAKLEQFPHAEFRVFDVERLLRRRLGFDQLSVIPKVVERKRRRFSQEQKLALLEEAEKTSVTFVARKHSIAVRLVFSWKKELLCQVQK